MVNINKKQLRDPVCHMMVNKDGFSLEYQTTVYAFCSQQCLERFKSNPHLYIGQPGRLSPKQHGQEIIKKRRLKLGEPLTDNQSAVIITELENMMGIKAVCVEADGIYITYDLLQATIEQIEKKIEATGEQLGKDMAEKLKRAFIHYLEETELDNLEQAGHEHRH